MESEFTYVDTQTGLAALVAHLQPSRLIAIDTEADNLHHYATRVCLMQICAGDREFLVDTLAGLDLRPLFEEIASKTLIMHGSDYDIRLLWDMCKFRPAAVFDTMLAAQLLGVERIGLSSLLDDYLGIHHPKDSQKADWSRRPLPPKMIDYAARDVRHLHDLHRLLLDELEQLGRADWHRQRCEWQIEVATQGFPERDENAWRLGPARHFPPRALAALFELWHWREKESERLDRPPFKVMSNDYLLRLSLAVAEGNHRDAFESLPAGLRNGRARGLADALERGVQRDPKTLPRREENRERRQPLSAIELERQEKIRSHRDAEAARLKMDATLIASRSQIAQLVRDPSNAAALLMPWQVELLQPALDACLAGPPPGGARHSSPSK